MHSGLDCVPNHKNRAVSLPEKVFNFFKKVYMIAGLYVKEHETGKYFLFEGFELEIL
jgi:hypothetical protein